MFDARSILEGLVRDAAPSQGQQAGGGGLADILGELSKHLGQPSDPQGGTTQSQGGGLSDILGEIGRQLTQPGNGTAPGGRPAPQPQTQQDSGGGLGSIFDELQRQFGQAASPRNVTDAGNSGAGTSGSGGLGDILGQIKESLGQSGGAATGGGGGSIIDVLGQILGQATQGVKEGAQQIGNATGANDALGRATGGQSADDLLAKLKDLVQQNPLAAGTTAGGLGGLVLGTRTGRSIAGSAIKIGALALIGGLAYKAYQNYQAGRPLIAGATPPEAAPQGSGFEPSSVTHEAATHYIQAMIAAAAADGRIDEAEQQKLIASLKQAGIDAEAEAFLADELNNPKSIAQLAASVESPQEALQIYTAARIAIEPDSLAEKQFLAGLANALGIDAKLAAHIDATARAAA